MIKSFCVLVIIISSIKANSHFSELANTYLVTFSKGILWNKKLHYKEQKDIGNHIFYIKNLYHNHNILFAGSYNEQSHSLIVIQGLSKEKAIKTLNSSPAIKNKVLDYEIIKFNLTMLGKVKTHSH
jgi:uncharacterized protein YciI